MNTVYDWMKDGFTMVPNILFSHFAELNMNADELLIILYLLSQTNQGNKVDEMIDANQQLGWTSTKIASTINSLMQKQYISIELKPDGNGRQSDHYSLRLLFEKLERQYYQKDSPQAAISDVDDSRRIVQDFEKEFGRQLSPIELEKIAGWLNLDHFSYDLIRLALREAVLRDAKQLTYIDRILINWKDKNITRVDQAERQIQQFNDKRQSYKNYEKVDIPILNWDDL